MKQLPTLTAARLCLRQIHPVDLQDLYAVFSDETAMRYWSRPPMRELAEAQAYLDDIDRFRERGDLLQWGIDLHGQVVGTCTLFHIDPEQGRAEIGYILHPRLWGQGYASEALRRLFVHARDDMQMRRLEADIDPRNTASLRLLDRLGFVREGYMRERWLVAGELQDAVILGLLLHHWQA